MCDYSLHGIQNRLAEEGEVLALSSKRADARERKLIVAALGWPSEP